MIRDDGPQKCRGHTVDGAVTKDDDAEYKLFSRRIAFIFVQPFSAVQRSLL